MWERVKAIAEFEGDFNEFKVDRKQWILKELRDPVRLFGKNQGHPVRKKLCRIISHVSLIDQMVMRFFFGAYADAEGNHYPMLPTKKGIGFNEYHANLIGNCIYEISNLLDRDPVASDVRGWEKNYSSDCSEIFAEHMLATCEDRNPVLEKAAAWWKVSLTTTPYVTDSGDLIDYDDDKCQRSGCLMTTSSNGVARVACAAAIGNLSAVMGDDCLEWLKRKEDTEEDIARKYAEIGVPVRGLEKQSRTDFTFCSHRFVRQDDGTWKCWLATPERMLFDASFSKVCDISTKGNYLDEIVQMPESEYKDLITTFIECRHELLGAVAQHDQKDE